MRIVKCKMCGDNFTAHSSNCKYCPRCRELRNFKPKISDKKAKETLPIAEISKIGRLHNMTYGETVAAIEKGEIKI